LSSNDFTQLPPTLASAASLTYLDLSDCTKLELTSAELEACLPAGLRRLNLSECRLKDLPPFRQQ